MPSARKVLVVLVVAFVLFYIVSRPEASADAVRAVLGAVGGALGALLVFSRSLAS